MNFEEFKTFLLCVLLSVPVYFAVQFAWKWLFGGFNNHAIREHMLRGFSFGLGMSFALVVVVLVLKLLAGDK